MTQKQIKDILVKSPGTKVTHKTFIESEYILYDDGKLKDESGHVLNWLDFWATRIGQVFQHGWEVRI